MSNDLIQLKQLGIDVYDSEPSLVVDPKRMTATGLFVTTARDRQGDMFEYPLRDVIDTTYHRLNPIILLDHGLRYPLPIATARDPESSAYSVIVGDHEATQTSYFSQHSEEAEQVFHLIYEKILLGNSIGFGTLESSFLASDDEHKAGRLIKRCELREISWTGLPANQECVQTLLDKGIGGKQLAPAIKSLLAPYAPEKKVWVPGLNIDMKTEAKQMSSVDESQGGALRPDANDQKQHGEDIRDEAEHEEQEEAQEERQPLGAKMLKSMCEGIKAMCEAHEEHMGEMEHPKVKALIGKCIEKCWTMHKELDEAYKSNYGSGEEDHPEEEAKHEDEEPSETKSLVVDEELTAEEQKEIEKLERAIARREQMLAKIGR